MRHRQQILYTLLAIAAVLFTVPARAQSPEDATRAGSRLVVLDPLPHGLSPAFFIDAEPAGRLYVHDAETGVLLGHVGIALRGGERVAGVSEDGSEVYVVSSGLDREVEVLTIVSLRDLRVIAEVQASKLRGKR